MNKNDLKKVLDAHASWLRGEDIGVCANLRGVNLRGANLDYANLRGADLRGAYLRGAYLRGANLRGADLRGAYLGGANLEDADLRDADLSHANLKGADLRSVKLWNTIGNKEQIKSLQLETYNITYASDTLQIGCQQYDIDEWWGFDDDTISAMDNGALEWWKKWKPVLQQIIEMSPAKPTKQEG